LDSFDLNCCTASILHLVAIALDRYWAITQLDYASKRTPRRIALMITIIWVISISMAMSPHITGLSADPNVDGICKLTDNLTFQIVTTLTAFYLPLFVMCIIYWKIFQSAKFRIRKKAFNQKITNARKSIQNKDNIDNNNNKLKKVSQTSNNIKDINKISVLNKNENNISSQKESKEIIKNDDANTTSDSSPIYSDESTTANNKNNNNNTNDNSNTNDISLLEKENNHKSILDKTFNNHQDNKEINHDKILKTNKNKDKKRKNNNKVDKKKKSNKANDNQSNIDENEQNEYEDEEDEEEEDEEEEEEEEEEEDEEDDDDDLDEIRKNKSPASSSRGRVALNRVVKRLSYLRIIMKPSIKANLTVAMSQLKETNVEEDGKTDYKSVNKESISIDNEQSIIINNDNTNLKESNSNLSKTPAGFKTYTDKIDSSPITSLSFDINENQNLTSKEKVKSPSIDDSLSFNKHLIAPLETQLSNRSNKKFSESFDDISSKSGYSYHHIPAFNYNTNNESLKTPINLSPVSFSKSFNKKSSFSDNNSNNSNNLTPNKMNTSFSKEPNKSKLSVDKIRRSISTQNINENNQDKLRTFEPLISKSANNIYKNMNTLSPEMPFRQKPQSYNIMMKKKLKIDMKRERKAARTLGVIMSGDNSF
jgi:hypothetical protein